MFNQIRWRQNETMCECGGRAAAVNSQVPATLCEQPGDGGSNAFDAAPNTEYAIIPQQRCRERFAANGALYVDIWNCGKILQPFARQISLRRYNDERGCTPDPISMVKRYDTSDNFSLSRPFRAVPADVTCDGVLRCEVRTMMHQ